MTTGSAAAVAPGGNVRASTPAELVAAAIRGERRAVARLLSLVENDAPQLPAISAMLAAHLRSPHPGSGDVRSGHREAAQVVGLTGAPGVGKSTSTARLVRAYRQAGRRVGVLAVDPSSPLTGGALLGDRVRMTEHAGDPGVFIRSLASRGHLGGLSTATAGALRVLDAAGYDVILVETVGVGQAEVDIAALADTTCVLLAPGLGDGVQAVKAGILETADVLVVNKADQAGADTTIRDLTAMTRLGPNGGRPAVVRTVAARGEGVAELVAAIAAHRRRIAATGELDRRRLRRAAEEIRGIALATLRDRLGAPFGDTAVETLAREVLAGAADPYGAADRLVAGLVVPVAPPVPAAGADPRPGGCGSNQVSNQGRPRR